ncbi:unnamed protein product [Malassezia sympodialis ATCC 42132]|uniref:Similar to S.cerevisiae protein SPS19 (Peroxisomal 2,4-dienoyl-CoA reductase) n=1 Tax=Malassezia sympodialis (strain ATCC 42132) TaxID=1230383 RepID=M5ED13_MALS4|nr:uncharacterized protein MSY001_3230 [Malassezia sympodialis ATCC 42132]CCV00525.1 unnamed protein product [Malassezia sympodialis ATCC 42132]SHO79254.1 Similar to S.cerevisiae protein SPS19 (Peroxisomal 2,4-dienoyl-CoA reductase) [Malassezia sympodialis ATCC 42132]|eukprot:XP_018741713.1 uncharacterized protein MSY001_3230 [Malassezia sympodialis ATCC 42132]
MSSFRLAPASMLRIAARKSTTPASAIRAFSRASPAMAVKHWKAPARPSVSQSDMPINPGPNPDPKNIGVNAVINQRSEGMDKHVTTIFAEFSLFEKTAVVTGGNRGLGLEMALAFVEAGAHVFVIDRSDVPSEEFQKVAKHCQLLDRQIEFITADVTSADEMNEAMQYISNVSTTKTIDVVVANAGIMQTYPALDYPVDEFRKMLEVNTLGVFITAQAGARVMKDRKQNQGSIILTASMSGTVVNRDQQWVAYNTSKAAVLQMGRNLAAEWGPHNIRVNTLSPGYIRTNLVADQLDSDPEMLSRWSDANPLGRIGRPHELRGVIVWLASSASSFCNGADIIVSGGHTIW